VCNYFHCCGYTGYVEHDSSDPITLVGLVFESSAGLHHLLTPSIERELGVGGQSFDILVRLGRSAGGSLRMSDLAAQTGLTPSGLTRAIDRLVEAGLVKRDQCPTDRRVSYAILTGLGRSRIDVALDQHSRDVRSLLDAILTTNEQQELAWLLRKVRDRVRPEAASGAGSPCPDAAVLGRTEGVANQ